MANSTRMKILDEGLKKMQHLTRQHATLVKLGTDSTNWSFDDFQHKFEEYRLQWEDPLAQEHSNNDGNSETKAHSEIEGKPSSNLRVNSVAKSTNLGANLLPENLELEQESLGKPSEGIHRGDNNKTTSKGSECRLESRPTITWEEHQPDFPQETRFPTSPPSSLEPNSRGQNRGLLHADQEGEELKSLKISGDSHQQLESHQQPVGIKDESKTSSVSVIEPYLKVNSNPSVMEWHIESEELGIWVVDREKPIKIGLGDC